MNNFVLKILLIIFFEESHSKWILEWNDEFDNKTIDTEKWEIENELISCHGNYIDQLNCNTNNSRNLQLFDGTLAIAAIYERHLDKEYTSAKITTKPGFTYGRFEIRAALPNGKMLRPAIFMIPVISDDWARNGQIDIMTNVQTAKLGAGIHYNAPTVYEGSNLGEFTADTNLNNFHTITIEWNEFEFKWFFDDINHSTVDINRKLGEIYTKNGEPFHKPFRLVIHLGVGSRFFPNQVLTIDDVIGWKCSLLIIDYVRIYKWVNGTEKLNSTGDRVSSDKICSSIMPLISPQNKVNIGITTIVSVISSLLLLLLIPILVFLFINQKKLKRLNVENKIENYYDICDSENNETIDVGNQYSDPYQELSEYYVEIYDKVENLDKSDQKEDRNSDPNYLKIFS